MAHTVQQRGPPSRQQVFFFDLLCLLDILVPYLTTQAGVKQEGGTSVEKMSPSDWPIDKPLGHFLN